MKTFGAALVLLALGAVLWLTARTPEDELERWYALRPRGER